jgi:hypothetical protein
MRRYPLRFGYSTGANPGLPQIKAVRLDFSYTASYPLARFILELERIRRIIPLELHPMSLTIAHLQHMLTSSLGAQRGILPVV